MDFSTASAYLNLLLGVLGLVALCAGSRWLVHGAAATARRCRIPETVVGLTVVSIGTSLPELATNLYAVAVDQSDVAMGNVTGSNVTNVLLVLGLTITCLGRIETDRILFGRDVILMFVLYLVFAGLCYGGLGTRSLTRVEGALLLGGCLAYTWHLWRGSPDARSADGQGGVGSPLGSALLMLGVGLLLVPLGAKLLVDNVVWAARQLHIPEAAIAATVIALGTSLPELAVTVAGVLQRRSDISMGNIVGSNIFNIILVMGAAAAWKPVAVGPAAAELLLPAMLLSGLAMLICMRSSWALRRWEGIVFVGGYVAFVLMNLGSVL